MQDAAETGVPIEGQDIVLPEAGNLLRMLQNQGGVSEVRDGEGAHRGCPRILKGQGAAGRQSPPRGLWRCAAGQPRGEVPQGHDVCTCHTGTRTHILLLHCARGSNAYESSSNAYGGSCSTWAEIKAVCMCRATASRRRAAYRLLPTRIKQSKPALWAPLWPGLMCAWSVPRPSPISRPLTCCSPQRLD